MRVFDHYPQDSRDVCPVCQTRDDKPCVLIGIVGTQEGNIVEAVAVHLECVELFWIKEDNLFVQIIEPIETERESSDEQGKDS